MIMIKIFLVYNSCIISLFIIKIKKKLIYYLDIIKENVFNNVLYIYFKFIYKVIVLKSLQ